MSPISVEKPTVIPEEPANLALLLVHGIGQPKSGSTIEQVGNALLEWFTARLSGTGRSVELERSLLKPGVRGDSGRARATLLIRDKNNAVEGRLRLVESLWADEFDPPGFFTVLRWILGPGTWLLLKHFVDRPYRVYRRWSSKSHACPDWLLLFSCGFGVLIFFCLVLPVQLIGILIALMRLLPIDALRTPKTWLAQITREIIGDSYLFAQSPVVRRALADRVRQDFDALRADGTPVAILAHSQGAAVAFTMVERHPNPPPLVTYGAGIRKLHELVGDADSSVRIPGVFRSLWWIAIIWIVAVVGLLADILTAPAGYTEFNQWPGMSFTAILIVYFIAWMHSFSAFQSGRETDESLAKRIRKVLAKQPAWLDLFATHDLVPDGPLISSDDPAIFGNDDKQMQLVQGLLDSTKIVNHMSATADHTSYWSNPDGFIDPVASWLGRKFQQDWLCLRVADHQHWCNRRCRTSFRYVLNFVLLIGVLALLFRAGKTLREMLPDAAAASEVVSSRLPGVLEVAKPLVESVVGFSYSPVMFVLLLVVHVAALAAYDALVLRPNWQALDRELGLNGTVKWVRLFCRFALFIAFFILAAYSLVVSINNASYIYLVQVPIDILLDVHRYLFVGDLPAALDKAK